MSIADDMRWMVSYQEKGEWQLGGRDRDEPDGFGYILIHLFLKADRHNYQLLKSAFPNVERAIAHWRDTGEILEGLERD